MNKILVIDLNNICYRFVEIHQNLSFKGMRTGMLYGFLNTFCKYVNSHEPDSVIICSDTPPYKRKELFPEYKHKNTVANIEKMLYIGNSRHYIKEVLEMCNIEIWKEKGYEADDLEAIITNKYPNDKIVICSNDDDLYCLLNKNVSLQRNKVVYTEEDFWKEFPDLKMYKTPVIWERVKAMAGNHNGVKNIYRGLGDKTAIKILCDNKKLEEFMNLYEKKFRENLKLTKLPFDWLPNVPELKLNNKFSLRKLENHLMREYGINPTEDILSAFGRLGGR